MDKFYIFFFNKTYIQYSTCVFIYYFNGANTFFGVN